MLNLITHCECHRERIAIAEADGIDASTTAHERLCDEWPLCQNLRVLVCGGRDYDDYDRLKASLDYLHASRPITLLIHGAAKGADNLANLWAIDTGVNRWSFPAKWKRDDGTTDRGAGPKRNQQMLEEGRPNGAVAFPGGRGTADMCRRLRAAQVPVWCPYN